MTQMVQQAIWLGYHPREWKRAHGILLKKRGKRDLTLVKSYRVITLLNFMGKLVEKVIAEQLSQFSDNFLKLHQVQMGARNEKCAIDAVVLLIHEVEHQWAKKKLAATLFVDVKGAFDHVSKTQLIAVGNRRGSYLLDKVIPNKSKTPALNRRSQQLRKRY